MTSRITADLQKLTGSAVTGGAELLARLVHSTGGKHAPVRMSTNAVVSLAAERVAFNASGTAQIDLIRTSDLPEGWSYEIILTGKGVGERSVVFTNIAVPDSDQSLDQLLGQVTPGRVPPYVLITEAQLDALVQNHGVGVLSSGGLSGSGRRGDPMIIADDGVTRPKLSQLLRDELGGSVPFDGLSSQGDGTIDVAANDGRAPKQLDIGIDAVAAAGELNRLTGPLRVDYNALKNTPSAIPPGGFAPQSAVDAVDHKADANASEIDSLQAFEAALRDTSAIVTAAAWEQRLSTAATRLPGAPVVPGAQADARLRFVVAGDAQAQGGITLAAFRAIAPTTQTTQLDTSNSFAFSGGGETFHVARESGTNQFLVAASGIGDYTITISLDVVEVHDGQLETPPYTDARADARALAQINTQIPTSTRIPDPKSGDAGKVATVNASEDGIELVTPETGGGVDSSAVNTLIDTRIPVVRRVPEIDTADANKVLKVNSGGTAADWEDDETGGGGQPSGTPLPWRITEVRRTTSQGDLRTPAGTGTIGTTWTAEQNLIDYTVPADSGGGLIAFFHALAVSPAGVQGGDRLYIRANVYRVRGAASVSLTDKTYYIRNSGQLSATANAASRRGDITFALPIDVETGDIIRLNVQAIAQVAGRNSVTWARTTNDITILRPPSGVGGVTTDTAAVNALINAAIPQAQRVPGFNATRALQHLRVNAAGTALEWAAPPAGLTQSQVDARINAVAPGLAATVAQGSIRSRVELFAQDGTRDRVPEARLPQKLDDLLDTVDEKGWTDAGSDPTRDVWVSNAVYVEARPSSPQTATYVRTLDDETPARQNVYVLVRIPDAGGYAPGDNLRLNVGERNDNYNIASSSSDWVLLSRIGGNRYYSAAIASFPAEADIRAQFYSPFQLDAARVNAVPTNGSDGQFLERVSGRGQWRGIRQVPAGGTEGQLLRRGSTDPEWYTQPPAPHNQVVMDGPGAGVSVTSLVGTQQTAFTLFSPTFDLDDHAHGEFASEIRLTIGTRSTTTLGFGTGHATTFRITDITFRSTLAALGDFAVGDTATWLQIGDPAPVFVSSTQVGQVAIYYGHNGDNELGYIARYEGRASDGNTFAFATRLSVLFSPTDAAQETRTLTATNQTRGRLLASTPNLPTTGNQNNVLITTAGARWTRTAAGIAAGYGSGGNRFGIVFPQAQGANELGAWLVVQVGGVDTLVMFLPHNFPLARTFFDVGPDTSSNRAQVQLDRAGNRFLAVYGYQTFQFRPNTRFYLYEAVVNTTVA